MQNVPIVSPATTLALALALTLSLGLAACGSDTEDVAPEFAVRVVGTLAATDLVQAQTMHDQVAAGGEADARAAGDFGHAALLGTTLLGTTENQFLGMDRWTDRDAMTGFYSNPAIADGFAALFAGPPSVEMFALEPDWHGWGSLTSGDAASPHYFVAVRGRLARTVKDAQDLHDSISKAGEKDATAAGDVAHVVFSRIDDPLEFMAIDIWTDDSNLESLYSDPMFQESLSGLFAGPVTIGVYASTDWHQW